MTETKIQEMKVIIPKDVDRNSIRVRHYWSEENRILIIRVNRLVSERRTEQFEAGP